MRGELRLRFTQHLLRLFEAAIEHEEKAQIGTSSGEPGRTAGQRAFEMTNRPAREADRLRFVSTLRGIVGFSAQRFADTVIVRREILRRGIGEIEKFAPFLGVAPDVGEELLF